MQPDSILANAKRLTEDARYMHDAGRSRSAATLAVVALEQFGSYVEELTMQKYPNAITRMGIFGSRPNAHGKRQDALASHVLNSVMAQITTQFLLKIFLERTQCADSDRFLKWVENVPMPIEFTDEQRQRMRDNKEIGMASLLMQMTREKRLQELREFGLYDQSTARFSDAAIQQVVELAEAVEAILIRAETMVTPEPMGLAGINMPEGIVIDDEGRWRSQLNLPVKGSA